MQEDAAQPSRAGRDHDLRRLVGRIDRALGDDLPVRVMVAGPTPGKGRHRGSDTLGLGSEALGRLLVDNLSRRRRLRLRQQGKIELRKLVMAEVDDAAPGIRVRRGQAGHDQEIPGPRAGDVPQALALPRLAAVLLLARRRKIGRGGLAQIQCRVSSERRCTNSSVLRKRVAVLIGITTGHSSPLELCMVTSSTESSDASLRPSGSRVCSSQSCCRSRTRACRPSNIVGARRLDQRIDVGERARAAVAMAGRQHDPHMKLLDRLA